VTDILFYHLQHQPLERVLPVLLEKSVERGWKVAVEATTPERVEALDALLWTYSDESFLAHGTDRESPPAGSMGRPSASSSMVRRCPRTCRPTSGSC
jgi:DNA polymerase III subunit chi